MPTVAAEAARDADGAITGWAAFRHRDYRIVFVTGFTSSMAIFSLQIAIGWEMWQATREEFYLGLVGLFAFMPALLFFPIAGMVADRFPRRLVLAVCYTVQGIAALLLLAAFTVQNVHPLVPLCLIALAGAGRAFSQPTGAALLPNVVPPQHLPNAVAWSSSARQLSMVIGPAVGGFLLALGTGFAFGAIATMFALCTILIVFVKTPRQVQARGPVTLAVLFAGFRFIFSRQIVAGAMVLDFVAVMAGTCFALLPVYATDILNVGELGLGFLRSVWAVGATVCALILTHVAIRRNAGIILLATVAVYGVAMAVFGFSTILWVSMAALFVGGAADMISVYIRDNLVQFATPDEMRGRVQSVNSVFTLGSTDLGQLKSGLLAEAIGVVPSVVIGGVGVLGIVALWLPLFPRLRAVDGLDQDSIRRASDHG
jgi:MFS family permease